MAAKGGGGGVGGGVENVVGQEGEMGCVVTQDPAVIGIGVRMAAVADIQNSAGEGERGSLQMLDGGERDGNLRQSFQEILRIRVLFCLALLFHRRN